MDRYFLRFDAEGTEWQEVSLAQYINAEHAAGFCGGNLERGCTATASFSGNGVRGHVKYDRGTGTDTKQEAK